MKELGALALGAVLVTATWPSQAQEVREIARACAADVDRLAAGGPPGEGRIKACIKAHVTEFSAPCFDTLLGAVAAEKEPR